MEIIPTQKTQQLLAKTTRVTSENKDLVFQSTSTTQRRERSALPFNLKDKVKEAQK